MFYYTYQITLTQKDSEFFNHYYLGKRQTETIPSLDNYHGSSSLLHDYFMKYPHDYNKIIIAEYDSEEELNKAEYELIKDHINDEYCLNKFRGGLGGNTFELQDTIGKIKRSKNISESKKGKQRKYSDYDTYIQKLSISLTGREFSEEHRRNISEAKKNKSLSEEHKLHIKEHNAHNAHKWTEAERLNYSYKFKELYNNKPEIKDKISSSVKKSMDTPEIKQKCRLGGLHTKGLLWMSNDFESIRINKEEIDKYLSLGYIRGRKKSIKTI